MSTLFLLAPTLIGCAPGPLGEDSANAYAVPQPCDPSQPWVDVTTGVRVTCGVHADGCAECWGAPAADPEDVLQSGGSDHGTSGFVMAVPPGPWSHIILNAQLNRASNPFACGLRPTGGIECWGHDWQSASTGPWTSPTFDDTYEWCAIDGGGGVWCKNLPPPGAQPSDLVVYERSDGGSIALASDGSLWAQSGEEAWELYDGGGGPPYRDGATDGDVTCGVEDAGGLSCRETPWWYDREEITNTPDGEFLEVCLVDGDVEEGEDFACARRVDGTVVCWGSGIYDAPSDEVFDSLSCGYVNACGVTRDQRIVCWGACSWGECDPPS